MSSLDDKAAKVRAFNRFFTRLIGVLNEGLLGSPYSLTEVRVLFELRAHGSSDAARLRRDLDLDAGYLSRILKRFSSDGLVARHASPDDGRRHVLTLTAAGRQAFDELDAKSSRQIRGLLAELPETAQDDLTQAMDRIRAHLDPDVAAMPVQLRAPEPGELGWMVSSNGRGYAAEYGWNGEYEALVARIVADFAGEHDSRREAVWIAELDGQPAGAIMCRARDDVCAKLRVLWVEPWARGHGVGRALVHRCVEFARETGYQSMTLWTVSLLASARRLYQGAGFGLESEEPVYMFGHDLTAQVWTKTLI